MPYAWDSPTWLADQQARLDAEGFAPVTPKAQAIIDGNAAALAAMPTYSDPAPSATPDAPAPSAPSAPAAAQGAPTPPPGFTDAQKSAKASIQATLDEFGLGGLADSLWQRFLGGTPMEQILLDLRKTPEYKTRFPGMEGASKNGRAINEAEYISIERGYVQKMKDAGLPAGFYDSPDDFGRLIGADVSVNQLGERLSVYTRAAMAGNSDVVNQLTQYYGVTPGDLAAYYIDPDKALSIIVQNYEAASRGAVAKRSGWGEIDKGQAERLVGLGVTDKEAEQGFGALIEAKELFGSLDAGEDVIDQTTQFGAAFEGNSVARRKIEDRRRRRKAQFEAGGSFAAGERGVAGLGTVAT